ncbi:hypothetical protein IWZ03DRAFT_391204 [Phyllosticta citriasiana]|uniref:Secreted protein n=1 Tax=Phyllosticta citriasiana TaxID=595635 RepID=A0ABR1K7D2_9PEZI
MIHGEPKGFAVHFFSLLLLLVVLAEHVNHDVPQHLQRATSRDEQALQRRIVGRHAFLAHRVEALGEAAHVVEYFVDGGNILALLVGRGERRIGPVVVVVLGGGDGGTAALRGLAVRLVWLL